MMGHGHLEFACRKCDTKPAQRRYWTTTHQIHDAGYLRKANRRIQSVKSARQHQSGAEDGCQLRVDQIVRTAICQLAGISEPAVARNETQVGKATGEIDRQKSWIDIARLADHCPKNLVIVETIPGANYCGSLAAK